MHRLNRPPAVPGGLTGYSYLTQRWTNETPNRAQRDDIWVQLHAMQGQRCAYCEAALRADHRDGHIEHFRQRSRYPQGTFDWNNLFGSCERKETCGRHKDDVTKCGNYAHSDLIKPDLENPDEYLVFDAHGGVAPRAGLDTPAHRRATQTIRILNLTGGGLGWDRRKAVMGYLQWVEEWEALAASCPEDEWRPLVESALADELARTAHLPYATAIRHVLCRVVA